VACAGAGHSDLDARELYEKEQGENCATQGGLRNVTRYGWRSEVRCWICGVGQAPVPFDVIVCLTYIMTDPTRGMAYARLYSPIGNPVQEVATKAPKVSGGARKNSTPQTADQIEAAKIKAWNFMVPREIIMADYYSHLVSNVHGVLWDKVGVVLHSMFCEPATDILAPVLNIKSGKTAWDTAPSRIVPANKSPPQMPPAFAVFFKNLLYFDSGGFPPREPGTNMCL